MNLDNLIFLYSNLNEPSVVTDSDGKVLYSNVAAEKLFQKLSNILDLEHSFSFDVGILNTDMLLNCNPIRIGFDSKEPLYCECSFQQSGTFYKNFCLRTIRIDEFIIFNFLDITAVLENEQNTKALTIAKQEISKLRVSNKEYSRLKQMAEAQSIKTSLVNRISFEIRDSLNIEEILLTAVKEISVTIGAFRGRFAAFNEENSSFVIRQAWNMKANQTKQKPIELSQDLVSKYLALGKLYKTNIVDTEINSKAVEQIIVPVIYQKKLLGILTFYQSSPTKKWQEEETSFVEIIASQLATAIKQASLFNEIKNQKIELQKALKELQEAQIQLIQTEKMASIGQLVAGVAHEINTPLASIKSNNSMLEMAFSSQSGNFDVEMVNNIIGINSEAISRIDKIVKSLKNFARLDEALLAEYDIHDGLNSTLDLIHHEIKNRINVVKKYNLKQKIDCYPDLLNQVFMNILVNAYQSIENKGEITIQTDLINEHAVISISDTGCGIPQKIINKIFDPGFTTKGVGVGTGLGLAISYKIIKKHGGELRVRSKENEYTKFEIQIPANFKANIKKC